MSGESWKAEFYPVDASALVGSYLEYDKQAEIEMVKHSLQKWKGLTKENLEKHEVSLGWSSYALIEKKDDCTAGANYPFMEIDNESCALCQAFLYEEDNYNRCGKCPLYRLLGDSCDCGHGPYSEWIGKGNAKPMISDLERTLAMLEGEEK